MARAISYWPRRCSKARAERERMPPGAKKSWRFGRFSGGNGVIEMGAEVDNVRIAYGSRGTEAVQFL
jgi:hypothetical protein